MDAPIVRLDAVNAERGVGLNAEPIPADEWDHTYAEAYRRLDQTLASGSSVIFDHVNFTRAGRDRLREIAAEHGARVQIVYVPVTVDEARRRLLANRESGARYDVRDDDFEHVVTHFEPPDDESDVVRRQPRV